MARMMHSLTERKDQFLRAGILIAKSDGIRAVTCKAVADKCGVTAPMVFHAFGTRDALRKSVIDKLPAKQAREAREALSCSGRR